METSVWSGKERTNKREGSNEPSNEDDPDRVLSGSYVSYAAAESLVEDILPEIYISFDAVKMKSKKDVTKSTSLSSSNHSSPRVQTRGTKEMKPAESCSKKSRGKTREKPKTSPSRSSTPVQTREAKGIKSPESRGEDNLCRTREALSEKRDSNVSKRRSKSKEKNMQGNVKIRLSSANSVRTINTVRTITSVGLRKSAREHTKKRDEDMRHQKCKTIPKTAFQKLSTTHAQRPTKMGIPKSDQRSSLQKKHAGVIKYSKAVKEVTVQKGKVSEKRSTTRRIIQDPPDDDSLLSAFRKYGANVKSIKVGLK